VQQTKFPTLSNTQQTNPPTFGNGMQMQHGMKQGLQGPCFTGSGIGLGC
jgi:hypothetical protein